MEKTREEILKEIELLEEKLADFEDDDDLKQMKKDARKQAKLIKIMQEQFEEVGLGKELAVELIKTSLANNQRY